MENKYILSINIIVRLSLCWAVVFSSYITGSAQVVHATDKLHQTAVDYVDPLIGTFSTTALSAGNTYPTIGRPFGMNTWSPQTGDNLDRGLYTYQSNFIYGFRQTRQASYWIGDYGQFSLMPVNSVNQFTQESRKSWFSHKAETVSPYFYKVYLGDHHAHVALTATERAAIFKIDFHLADSAFIVVDAFNNGSSIKISPDGKTVEGFSTVNQGGVPGNFRNYFVMKFSEPFISAATWLNDSLYKGQLEIAGDHSGAIIGFENSDGKTIEVKVASSFISFEQAYINLKELGNDTFEAIKQKSKEAWNQQLQKISIQGATTVQLRTFYSAFYRMLIFPRKFYEINKQGNAVYYSPFTGKIRNGKLYADNGFWDTYRAEFPFLNLFFPEIVSEVLESMANTYKESGWLPEWFSPGHRDCMIGSHSASIIADAYLKNIKVAGIGLLYKALLQNTVKAGPVSSLGRLGVDYYNKLGYVPDDVGINQNVSRTLEYAYDDFAVYQLAKAMGRDKDESDVFLRRSKNYKNLYDPSTGLMRPRDSSGAFMKEFDPFKWGDHFTEGNSWQYSWSVAHDPLGLANLMGGTKAFVTRLDAVFSLPPVFDISYYKRGIIHLVREMQGVDMGQYAHLNEPMHHVAYLYNYGAPWKAQYWVRQIMDRLYSDGPDGYPGEEDNGQMSAWYVFSALGFYPVNPVSNQYVFGSPLFKKAILRLGNGKILEVSAPDNSDSNYYIESVKFNNLSHRFNWIDFGDLSKGGKLIFEMGSEPNFNRAVAEKDFPFSVSALK
ncbi:MAG TPA: GH92 family glycosyl hydrolase [Arachidicoccus sp.]|nr:GH92 family glycosyl hydrolase [Arachidicoccus sp.]